MIQTKIIRIDPQNPDNDILREAGSLIEQGGLVIIPTETVYGVAANMLDEYAVARLSELKSRPKDKPYTIHIAEKHKVEDLAKRIPLAAYKLMNKFWPGPLTIVLLAIRGGTIGIRMPDDKIALEVIKYSGVPVICPSANISGKNAPKSFSDAIADFEGKVDIAIDSGDTRLGVESTVVDLSKESFQVLREGAIKESEISKAISTKEILFICTGNSCRSVMAEALLKKIIKEKNRDDVIVSSAGIMMLSGLGVSQGTKEVLAKEGIDFSNHRSQRVSAEMIRKSDLILVMEKIHEDAILRLAPEVKNRVFLLKEFAKIKGNRLDIPDPIGKSLEFYEQTFAAIKEAVERISNLI